MVKYVEPRFYHYQDILNKPGSGNYLSLLPLTLKNISIGPGNSFLVSDYSGKNLNMEKFINVNLSILYRSLQNIAQKQYNNIFQIVEAGDCFYINPWFKQPSEILFKDYFVVGRYKENKRIILFKANKLFANHIFKPHHNSICVIGSARNPPTLAHQEAINRNNTIISIDDYIELLKKSSLGIYFKN